VGRKAWRCPGRGHSRLTIFLKFGYVLMPFVAFRSPLRSAFSRQFRSIFECDGHQNATRLSVPEIELLVELSTAFDFCSSYCFIFIMFLSVYSFAKIRWGFQFSLHSHWGSIKIAGSRDHFLLLGKIKIFAGYWGG